MSQDRPLTRQDLEAMAEEIIQHTGEVFKIRRTALDLTLEDVHALLEIDGANLSHFEKGKERVAKGKKRGHMSLQNFFILKLYYDLGWQALVKLPPSTSQRLITRILQMPDAWQESLLYVLDHGCGEGLPPDAPAIQPSCVATSWTV